MVLQCYNDGQVRLLFQRYGTIEIDLFASHLITQYFSWWPDPSADRKEGIFQVLECMYALYFEMLNLDKLVQGF